MQGQLILLHTRADETRGGDTTRRGDRNAGATEERPDWRLDNLTRDVGHRGVAQARAALRASVGRRPAA